MEVNKENCQPGCSRPWLQGDLIWLDEYPNSPLTAFVYNINIDIETISVKRIEDGYITLRLVEDGELKLTKKELYSLLTRKV